MKHYTIFLDKEYIFEAYENRYQVLTTKATIIVYAKAKDSRYEKTFCEFVDNPKSYLHDNPPVNEALNNNIFLLLLRDDKEIDDNLKGYYIGTLFRLNEYFKNNYIELI